MIWKKMNGKEFIEELQKSNYTDEGAEFIVGEQIHKGNIDIEPIVKSYFNHVDNVIGEYSNDIIKFMRIVHYLTNGGGGVRKEIDDITRQEIDGLMRKYETKFGYKGYKYESGN